jgi:hypothetical protein
MYCKKLLIADSLPTIADQRLLELQINLNKGVGLDSDGNPFERFCIRASDYLTSSKRNQLLNIDQMPHIDIIIGCQHFIDNLLLKYGLSNLQILEYDYKYYNRLNSNIIYALPGKLVPGIPLLIAAPFPGYLDLHPQWNDIIDECNNKSIDVHVDGAWLGAATDITINLAEPCIKTFAQSLSKGLGLGWNRIGLRWSKQYDPSDSISILNQFNMIPQLLVRVGLSAMNQIPVDYLWNSYEEKYFDICKSLKLRPTKIIHAAKSLDRTQLYGLKNFFNQNKI